MNRLWNIRRTQPAQPQLKWVPIQGELQKTLQRGEYLPLRPLPMFESNFVQVTNSGGPVFLHHRANKLTMGVAASLPGLVLPDTLLIARPPEGQDRSSLLLSRVIPLNLVHLYVHDMHSWRLKLRLVTGRYYYLELDAPDHEAGFLFDRWIYLINLLREPATTWAPRTPYIPSLDHPLDTAPASTWRLQVGPQHHRSQGEVEVCVPTFPYKMSAAQKQKKAKALKRNFKSQAVGDSMPAVWPRLAHADTRKKATGKQSYPEARSDRNITRIQLPDKTSITIRTIFSIISNTINQSQSSLKACISDSEGAPGPGGLIENPLHCISSKRPDLPLMDSCDQLDMLLWHQDFEDLLDPESSTLTSSSLGHYPHSPALRIFPPHSPPLRFSKKATPKDTQCQGPPPTKKAPSASGAPFTKEQPHKVVVVPQSSKKALPPHAPFQKAPAVAGPPQKAPPGSVVPQKTPALVYPSSKASAAPALPQKAPPLPQKVPHAPAMPQKAQPLPQKVPHAPAMPQKPLSSPAPKKKPLVHSAPSQKAPDSPPPQDQAPAGVEALPAVVPTGNKLEKGQSKGKPEQVVIWGDQGTKVVEARTTTKSLELPHATAKKESKELLISKTRELALDNLEGRQKLENMVHKMKEEVLLDLPHLRSKEVEQRQRWVKTQEVVFKGPLQEHSRPFSMEGITLAKLIITASSKEEHPKPAKVTLSSWLSMDSQKFPMPAADRPFGPSQLSLVESSVVAEDQSPTWEENSQWEDSQPLRDPVGPSRGPASNPPVSDNTQVVTSISNTLNRRLPLSSVSKNVRRSPAGPGIPKDPGDLP
ncbi:protein FAM71E2 [Perognathus longimembris pacificus]|uniref:protein FAM71E2 n=1 Tax=Perognathus longimembris pacificus TaxID=214514 RepID=UPI0020186A81|nr:protein FAM71E2 [Perognathus longimembris pacificus]